MTPTNPHFPDPSPPHPLGVTIAIEYLRSNFTDFVLVGLFPHPTVPNKDVSLVEVSAINRERLHVMVDQLMDQVSPPPPPGFEFPDVGDEEPDTVIINPTKP